nr:agouti-signaling protein-like isoform X2 [Doryrhamphus excisus]
MKLTGKLFCLLLLVIHLCCIVDTKNVGRSYNDTVGSQMKTRRLFARQKTSRPAENPAHKDKPEDAAPVRRCSPLRETCSAHMPCCDPCSSCRCRLFNMVCHCWRVNTSCLKGRKTPRMRIGIGTM